MLPLTNAQMQQSFNRAVALINQRKLDEAERSLRVLLQAQPKSVGVHFHLARIHIMRAESELALKHLEIARAYKPDGPNIWLAYAEVLANSGSDDQVKKFLEEVKAARLPAQLTLKLQDRFSGHFSTKKSSVSIGDAKPGEVQNAIDLLRNNNFVAAEKAARKLYAQHPKVGIISLILANALGGQNKLKEARQKYELAVNLEPDYPEARNTFGRFLYETGDYDRASRELQAALKLRRDMPQALVNYAMLLGRKGQYPFAIENAQKALSIDPKHLEACLTLGRLLTSVARDNDATAVYERALENGLEDAAIYARLGSCYSKMMKKDLAMENFAKSLKLDPNSASTYSLRAAYSQELGDFDAAEADFRKALELLPQSGETYRSFIAGNKIGLDDPVVDQLRQQLKDPHLMGSNKANMNFAMAAILEQNKSYDQVFTYLKAGNDLMNKLFPYDINQRRAEIDRIKLAFSKIDLSPIEGTSDFAPIFVTGMPRSGTTLVEQILSSHSLVGGAGENAAFVGNLSLTMNQRTPNWRPIELLSDDELLEVGRIAEQSLKLACPGEERVVDKAIQTYIGLGAVKKIFPNASIVLVRRDPRDCLFSIYKNVFIEGAHRYAYNLTDLGLYYRMFEEMVEFWREKLPGGFHEIQYEDLIDNPEDETRKLLQACDLEWEDSCLSFHENKRRVATLSVAQVRQPIYKSSQAAWKRHEDDLAELIEALGDAI